MNKTFSAIVFATILPMMGCNPVRTDLTPLSQGEFTRKPRNCDIQVLTQMPSDRKYEEISIINASGNVRSLNEMLPKIKAKACEIGADAIVVKTSTTRSKDAVAQAYIVAIKFI